MEKRFAGKSVLVTGAGSGIGRGIALRFAKEGAFLSLADINPAGVEETAAQVRAAGGAEPLLLTVDVSNIASIQAMADAVVARFGRIDCFVNSAGIVQSRDFLEVDEASWDRIIDINQKGTAFSDQIVARAMAAQVPDAVKQAGRADKCYGKIVNFSSIAGRRGRSFQVHYAASKAAVISITQTAALRLAPLGINVNAVSPSVVVTPMWNKSITEKAATLGVDVDAATEEMVKKIPLLRVGTTEDIAGAVSFLCSSDADFITGQTINVDGGFEMS